MKRKLQLITAVLATCAIQNSFGQMSGANAFMIGDYVEIGINAEGYEGAPLDVGIPTHYRGYIGYLGFVANPQEDGWVEYNGDFYMPGTPENGFGITYTLSSGDTVSYSNNAAAVYEIPGEITDFSESSDSVSVTWTGVTPDSLKMIVRYDLQKDQHYYTTTITLVNIGSESFTDVFYYRNLDPDVNQDIFWGYATDNAVESQSGMADDSVRVVASQDEAWIAEMIFHAYGSDWKGYRGGFYNRDGNMLWNGVGVILDEGPLTYADQSIGLVHHVPSILPGRAAADDFSFATAFKRGIVFASEPGDTENINENNQIEYQLYPNPTDLDYLTIEILGAFTYRIIDLKGSVIQNGQGNGTTKIDLSLIENGSYFIELTQNGSVTTSSIVIQ